MSRISFDFTSFTYFTHFTYFTWVRVELKSILVQAHGTRLRVLSYVESRRFPSIPRRLSAVLTWMSTLVLTPVTREWRTGTRITWNRCERLEIRAVHLYNVRETGQTFREAAKNRMKCAKFVNQSWWTTCIDLNQTWIDVNRHFLRESRDLRDSHESTVNHVKHVKHMKYVKYVIHAVARDSHQLTWFTSVHDAPDQFTWFTWIDVNRRESTWNTYFMYFTWSTYFTYFTWIACITWMDVKYVLWCTFMGFTSKYKVHVNHVLHVDRRESSVRRESRESREIRESHESTLHSLEPTRITSTLREIRETVMSKTHEIRDSEAIGCDSCDARANTWSTVKYSESLHEICIRRISHLIHVKYANHVKKCAIRGSRELRTSH